MSCFQCDLDIPHVCYEGMPNARWGLNDGAVAALEAAQHYLRTGTPHLRPALEKATGVKMKEARIPEGWKLEPLSGSDQWLLSTPSPSYLATIDFRLRGFRSGCVQQGKLIGEKLTKKGFERKMYRGRGWQQAIVDDAVAWLEALDRPSRPRKR